MLNDYLDYKYNYEQTSDDTFIARIYDKDENLVRESTLVQIGIDEIDNACKGLIRSMFYKVDRSPGAGTLEEQYVQSIAYQHERKNEYPSIGDQLDMIYKDMKYGTTLFVDTIDRVKTAYPKSQPVAMTTTTAEQRQVIADRFFTKYGIRISVDELFSGM